MYNAKKNEQIEGLKVGISKQSVITQINDGKVKDFLTEEGKGNWKGDLDHTAIEIVIETNYNDETYNTGRIFTYTEKEGVTTFKSNSNLGKYFRTYGKLPEVGDQVQMMTDANGYFCLVMNQ